MCSSDKYGQRWEEQRIFRTGQTRTWLAVMIELNQLYKLHQGKYLALLAAPPDTSLA